MSCIDENVIKVNKIVLENHYLGSRELVRFIVSIESTTPSNWARDTLLLDTFHESWTSFKNFTERKWLKNGQVNLDLSASWNMGKWTQSTFDHVEVSQNLKTCCWFCLIIVMLFTQKLKLLQMILRSSKRLHKKCPDLWKAKRWISRHDKAPSHKVHFINAFWPKARKMSWDNHSVNTDS